jgi:hypothetical protein
MTLAKVVCNLRKYYLQSKAQTVELIQTYYSPRYGYAWSAEAVELTWDLVEPYTPNMALVDETVVNRERADDLYDLVVDFSLLLEPGGRVLAADLYQFFLEQNPVMEWVPTDVAFGKAFGLVTGKKSASSQGKKYYSGFRIPEKVRLGAAA